MKNSVLLLWWSNSKCPLALEMSCSAGLHRRPALPSQPKALLHRTPCWSRLCSTLALFGECSLAQQSCEQGHLVQDSWSHLISAQIARFYFVPYFLKQLSIKPTIFSRGILQFIYEDSQDVASLARTPCYEKQDGVDGKYWLNKNGLHDRLICSLIYFVVVF